MVRKSPLLTFFFRLFSYTIIVILIVTIGIVAENNAPDAYDYADMSWSGTYTPPGINTTQWNIRFDSHSHTTGSDGVLTPEQNLQWHIANGFNAMAITDHITKETPVESALELRSIAREKYNSSIMVLLGTEWSNHRIHMNLIFPPNYTDFESLKTTFPCPTDPTDEQIQTTINGVHAVDGIVIVNHIPWTQARTDTHPTREQLLGWGIDYIEIYNGDDYDQESYEFCQANGIGMICGSDMHRPGAAYSYTLMNTSDYTENSIFNALSNRETQIYFNTYGHSATPTGSMALTSEYQLLKPVILLGQAIKSYDKGDWDLDWTGIGILLIYIYGFFGLGEIFRLGYSKLQKKVSAK